MYATKNLFKKNAGSLFKSIYDFFFSVILYPQCLYVFVFYTI